MDDANTVGARLRVLRKWRRLSQQQVADLAGLSQAHLSKIERGLWPLDRRSHIAGLANALKVSETDIVGGPHLSDDPVQSDPHVGIPALQVALETNSLRAPTIDRARPLADITRDLARLEPVRMAADYIHLGRQLPDIIDELHFHVADPEDEAAYQLALETLVEACMAASALAGNLGYRDVAYIAASRGYEAAAILDNPIQHGKAEFMRILNLPRAGTWSRTLIAAERAANELQPHATKSLDVQVLGMLALTASLAAASVHKQAAANQWLSEAEELARRVPDDPVGNWERFSATNVSVWRVTIGVELGESGGRILEKAQAVNASKLNRTSSRKAAFLADAGRGLAREPRTGDQAVRWLREAEKLAPQRIRNNARVRETVSALLTQSLAGAGGVELRGMAARMGVPH